jgi:hypothetical protein
MGLRQGPNSAPASAGLGNPTTRSPTLDTSNQVSAGNHATNGMNATTRSRTVHSALKTPSQSGSTRARKPATATAAVTARDHPAHPARLDPRRGLHDDPQPTAAPAVVLSDSDDVETVEPDEQITPIAVQEPERASTRRRLGHRRGLPVGSLVAPNPWEASTRSGSAHHRESLTPVPTAGTNSPILPTSARPIQRRLSWLSGTPEHPSESMS